MKKHIFFILLAVIVLIPAITEAQNEKPPIEISYIKDSVFGVVSPKMIAGNPYPANGLLVNTAAGIVMIDTPWDNEQTKELLNKIKKQFNSKVILAIITHAHEDRIGGIQALLDDSIRVISSALTSELAGKLGYPKPEPFFTGDTIINIGNVFFELYFPGEGHSADNIVVWLPQSRVLFGGSIIRAMKDNDLGNMLGANAKQWDKSVDNLMKKFPEPLYIVPGHYSWEANTVLYYKTIELIRLHNGH